MKSMLVGLVTLAGLAGAAHAQVTLNAAMTVDNQFQASISTSPLTQGTVFLSGANWPQTFTGSHVFTNPGTYYLHVLATDSGRPEMFIGQFDIVNAAGSTFGNGGTNLLTTTTDWVVSNTGFGLATSAPLDIGANGSGPWGNFPAMGAARFLWAPTYTPTVYFTAVINVVPAPGAAAGLLSLACVVTRRRR